MNVKSWYSDSLLFIVGRPNVKTENKNASLWGYFLRFSLLDPILIYLIPSKSVGTILAEGIVRTTILLPSIFVSSK